MAEKDGISAVCDYIMRSGEVGKMSESLEKWGVMCREDPKRAVKKMAGYIGLACLILSLNRTFGGPLSDRSKELLDEIENRGEYMQENHPKLFEDAVNCYREMNKWTRKEKA